MLKTAHNNTDLQSLLAKVQGGANQKASEGLGALGELLNNGGGQTQFSDILAGEGALQGISSEDLMSFFKNQGSSEADISELFSKLESPEGKEFLKSLSFNGDSFVNAEGKKVGINDLMGQLRSDDFKNFEAHLKNNKSLSIEKGVSFGKGKETNELRSAEDFLAQRKALAGKRVVAQQDGTAKILRTNPALNQYQKENKVINDRLIKVPQSSFEGMTEGMKVQMGTKEKGNLKGTESLTGNELFVNSSENNELAQILAMKNEGSSMDMMPKGNQNVKVVDLSQIQSQNKTELINQVSNYIEQAYVAGQDEIDLVVKHDELGQFRINASKTGPGNQIDLEIQTMTKQGQQFFVENEADLIKTLTKSGVKLSDIKLVGQGEFMAAGESRSQASDNGQNSQGKGEFSHQQNQRRDFSSQQDRGRERRQQMWQMAQENMMSA